MNEPKQITSNQDNSCRYCGKSWEKGDSIYYDSDTAALCVDDACCKKQIQKRIEKRSKKPNVDETQAQDKKESLGVTIKNLERICDTQDKKNLLVAGIKNLERMIPIYSDLEKSNGDVAKRFLPNFFGASFSSYLDDVKKENDL